MYNKNIVLRRILSLSSFPQVFDFVLTADDVSTLNNMPPTMTIMDSNSIQDKLDNPLPDGYKLKIFKISTEP